MLTQGWHLLQAEDTCSADRGIQHKSTAGGVRTGRLQSHPRSTSDSSRCRCCEQSPASQFGRSGPEDHNSAECAEVQCYSHSSVGMRKRGSELSPSSPLASEPSELILDSSYQTCKTVTGGGFSTCSSTGQCAYGCDSGIAPYVINGVYTCINTLSDANNCGSPGKVCQAAYNGMGSPKCAVGNCGQSTVLLSPALRLVMPPTDPCKSELSSL